MALATGMCVHFVYEKNLKTLRGYLAGVFNGALTGSSAAAVQVPSSPI
jgi:hypothetical protein